MRITLDYRRPTPSHCDVAVFVNGALAGVLTLRQDELAPFQFIVSEGMTMADDQFLATGNPEPPQPGNPPQQRREAVNEATPLHPLCEMFPPLAGDDFEALVDDISANGLRQPIVLLDGAILDGGNRYRACLEAGVDPEFEEFDGDDAVSFVLSANLHRRHLTAGQQAMIVASAQDWTRANTHGDTTRLSQAVTLPLGENQQLTSDSSSARSVADRAAASGVSDKTQRMADKVARADPELAKKVAHGEMSLPKAAAVVAGNFGARKPKPKPKHQAGVPSGTVVAVAPDGEEVELDYGVDYESLTKQLEDSLQEITTLQAQLQALEANDTKAELRKALLQRDHAVRQQSEAMDRAHAESKRHAWKHRMLMRCGRAVGVSDPDKIAPAVEAFVRRHPMVA